MNNVTQKNWIAAQQAHFEMALQQSLPKDDSVLHQAMRYSSLNGGKRLRPLLVYATGLCFDAKPSHLDQVAIAVELIHCYSLVHDDLPAMDDDALRRGKPSCHKQFDEATAILSGDALQSLAFDVLTQTTLPNQIALIHTLAKASGSMGMAGGQSLDMLSANQAITLDTLQRIHHLKTGALFSAAIQMGALASTQCRDNQLQCLHSFSQHLGLAFQIRDDILDVESNTTDLGKTCGKDASQHKATYPALLGLADAKKALNEHLDQAAQYLSQLDRNTGHLQQLMACIF